MFTHRRYRARRGVVLMVILGLMAMFGVVAITFVLLTGQAKRAADSNRRAGEYPEAPRAQLEQAGRIVLRGSPSHICALRHHSLLEDMYGKSVTYGDMAHQVQLVDAAGNPIPGAITAVGDFCRGQLIGFTPARAERLYGTSQYRYRPVGSPYNLVGCVLTMLHGVARNQSTRIVSYDAANNLLLILPSPDITPAAFIADVRNRNPILSRREYIVNGSAFTGTGFGCNTAGQNPWLLDACEPLEDVVNLATGQQRNGLLDPGDDVNNNGVLDLGPPYALLPNAMGFTMDRFAEVDGDPTQPDPGSYVDPAGPGGANEDYDVADYQNILLAAMLPNGSVPIPSVHRPALINYHVYDLVNWLMAAPPDGPQLLPEDAWRSVMLPAQAYNQGLMVDAGGFLTSEQIRDRILARKFKSIFRPLFALHQVFNGGNPVWDDWQQGFFYRPNPADPLNPTRKNIFESDVTAAEIQTLYWHGQQLPHLNRAPMLRGPWDVDCDGDGAADSIWIDLGFPIHTADDGRRYKPLFAIHCVDLDGRLNLNAHGCFAHTVMDSAGLELYGGSVTTSPLAYANAPPDPNPPPKSFPPIFLARAQGYGPPEVNLRPVLASVQEYRALLTGKDVGPPGVLHWLDGRYGEATALVTDADGNSLPDDPRAVAAGNSFVPGTLDRDNMQMLLADDPLSRNKHFQFCIRDPSTGNVFPLRSYADGVPNAFGTPPDYKGSMAIGLDLRGQPMYWPFQPYAGVAMDVNTQVPGGFDRYAWPSVNDPFEQNLSRNAARSVTTPAPIDNLFTVYELERVLRMYDRDAGRLANRLELLAPSLGGQRNRVTTESWDVPGPNLSLLPDESGPPFNHLRLRHFAQLFRQRFSFVCSYPFMCFCIFF